jgi:ribonuclease VapC
VTILDASAVLGLIQAEPRADGVLSYLADGAMSAVNHAEVIGKLVDVGMSATMAAELVDRLHIEVLPFTDRHAVVVGELRSRTSRFGLSLGDGACLATGLIDGGQVVTLDRMWAEIDLDVPVVVLG